MKGEEKPYQNEFNSVQEVSEKKKRKKEGGEGGLEASYSTKLN